MVTRNTSKNKARKGQVESLTIKRETIKDLTGREQEAVKGGGGAPSGVLGDKRPGERN